MTGVPVEQLRMSLLAGRFAVSRLQPDAGFSVPQDATFSSVTRTPDELSVVCDESYAPDDARTENGWRLLKLEGPFDFALTGVVSSVTSPLAAAGVPVFVVSTFDTDYLLVKEERLDDARSALTRAGIEVGESE